MRSKMITRSQIEIKPYIWKRPLKKDGLFFTSLNNGIPILRVRLGNVFHPIVRKCQDILILFFPNSAHNSEDDLAGVDIPRLNPYEPIFLLEEHRSNSDQGIMYNPCLYFWCVHDSTKKHRPFATSASSCFCNLQDLTMSRKRIFIAAFVTSVDFHCA